MSCSMNNKKSEYSSDNTCLSKANKYSPSQASCVPGTCKVYNTWTDCDICWTSSSSYVWKALVINNQCNTCQSEEFWCAEYNYVPYLYWTITLYDYLKNDETASYSLADENLKLWQDLWETCRKISDWTQHKSANLTWELTCDSQTVNYYEWWKNWECNYAFSEDNLISFFNQLWGLERYKTQDDDSTCIVEWRYATEDNDAPSISINWVWNVFYSNWPWCNLDRYISSYNDFQENYSNNIDYCNNITSTYNTVSKLNKFIDENPDAYNTYISTCEYSSVSFLCDQYRQRNTTWNPLEWEDLLKGLEITIWNDPSGIWEVQIRIWTCSYIYKPEESDLKDIINSSISASWVKDMYTTWFTIKYDESFTAFWVEQESLLDAMWWGERLDSCFDEWKNSLAVLTKDLARSSQDGISLSPNISEVEKKSYVKVDESAPMIQLEWDLTTVYTTTTWIYQPTGSEITNEDTWRNFTLEWNIKQLESYKWNTSSSCITTWTWNCSLVLPSNGWIYTQPYWVDSLTWIYTIYSCNGLQYPEDLTCEVWCPWWYKLNTTTNSCEELNEENICEWVYVWLFEAILWETAVNIDWDCIPYCIAGHTLWCIVKE